MRGLAGRFYAGNSRMFEPLLGVMYPWMFGTCLSRIGSGLLVLGFGQTVAYKEHPLDDDLGGLFNTDLLTDGRNLKLPATPTLSAPQVQEAVRWWVEQLSEFLSYVLDPTLFSVDGFYQPALHQGFAHAIERLITSVVRILLSTGTDQYTRMVHLFEVLDLLEGLSLGGYDQTLDADRLAIDLGTLRTTIPATIGDLLLPRCETALAALVQMQAGFSQSLVTSEHVEFPRGPKKLSQAVTYYLRLIRNGSHGLLKDMLDPIDRRVMAIHDGQIPSAVADVALLHLLRLLADPERIARPRMRRR
jgi:hypothetical protein